MQPKIQDAYGVCTVDFSSLVCMWFLLHTMQARPLPAGMQMAEVVHGMGANRRQATKRNLTRHHLNRYYKDL